MIKQKTKALNINRKWVVGELQKHGNVSVIVDWKKKEIAQVFPNTACEDVGAKIKSKESYFINDIYTDSNNKDWVVLDSVKKSKDNNLKEHSIVFRSISAYSKHIYVPLSELNEYKYTGRNILGKSALKNERFDSDTITNLFDKEMARNICRMFLYSAASGGKTIEGYNTLSYNILPSGNTNNGRLIMFSRYGCFNMPRKMLLAFTRELIDICEGYFNPDKPFTFELFEPTTFSKVIDKLS